MEAYSIKLTSLRSSIITIINNNESIIRGVILNAGKE